MSETETSTSKNVVDQRPDLVKRRISSTTTLQQNIYQAENRLKQSTDFETWNGVGTRCARLARLARGPALTDGCTAVRHYEWLYSWYLPKFTEMKDMKKKKRYVSGLYVCMDQCIYFKCKYWSWYLFRFETITPSLFIVRTDYVSALCLRSSYVSGLEKDLCLGWNDRSRKNFSRVWKTPSVSPGPWAGLAGWAHQVSTQEVQTS